VVNEFLSHALELLGLLLEILGALYLAHRYLNSVFVWQIPWALVSVWRRGKAAEGLAFGGELSREDSYSTIKGISLLIVGFVFKSAPHIYFIFDYLCKLIVAMFK
jgi:hypothetical protein